MERGKSYASYEQWKNWEQRLFSFDQEAAEYFEGECRGVAISDADVLEIGYGSGSCLAWAKSKGAKVAGTEIIPLLVDAGREFGVEILPPDFDDAASNYSDRFDTVIAFDVFEHLGIEDIMARLAALAIMLRPGGHLILRFPNAQSPFGLVPQKGDPTHRAELSRSVFELLIQELPFSVQRYAPSFRIGGRGRKGMARRVRGWTRDAIAASLNAVYATNIPWDPVVTLVLRRDDTTGRSGKER